MLIFQAAEWRRFQGPKQITHSKQWIVTMTVTIEHLDNNDCLRSRKPVFRCVLTFCDANSRDLTVILEDWLKGKKKKKVENMRTQCEFRTLSSLMWRNTSNMLPHWGRARAKDNPSMDSLGAGWVAACVGCEGKTGFGFGQEEIIFQRAVSPLQGNWAVINFWVHLPSGFSWKTGVQNEP